MDTDKLCGLVKYAPQDYGTFCAFIHKIKVFFKFKMHAGSFQQPTMRYFINNRKVKSQLLQPSDKVSNESHKKLASESIIILSRLPIASFLSDVFPSDVWVRRDRLSKGWCATKRT